MDLFGAIEAGNADQVRALVTADPRLAASRSSTGVSAVLWARYRNRPAVVDAVLTGNPELDVFDASALGRLDRLGELVDADPDRANAWSADGFTPLGLAAFFGHPDAVRFLIGRGADVHAVARNPMRVQPLHAATAARDVESVRLLLEAGADPDAQQQEGWTALMAARRHGDQEIVDLLLAHGAHDPPGEGAPEGPPEDGPPAGDGHPTDVEGGRGNRSSTS
jgi:uncharacterized protein